MKFIKAITLLLTTLLMLSCSADTGVAASQQSAKIEAAQLQKQWQLIGIDEQPVAIGIRSTLAISSTNKTTGNLACNYFFGMLNLANDKLIIENMGSTRKKCQDKTDEVELIVSAVLSGWSEVQLEDGRLTLIGKSHRLHYKAGQ